jgi:predicted phage terminase large subunit-like protein
MRRLLLSPFYRRYWSGRFTLAWDQNTKGQFDNTAGGSRISTSVRGGLLGLGGDVICIDDPHNTETEKKIESDADRQLVKSWWQEVTSTRLNDPKQSAIVVVMQRLHEEDLSGIILDSIEETGEDWTHFMVPMEFDADRCSVTVKLPKRDDDGLDHFGNREEWIDPRMVDFERDGHDGQLMWETRFGAHEVQRMKALMGPYMAAGRLAQSPSPKGGGILKRDWWPCWGEEQALRYGLVWNTEKGGLKQLPETSLVVASLDTAFKEKEENDYNALTIFGLWIDKNKNRRAMLQYAWQKRLSLHGTMLEKGSQEIQVQFTKRQQEEWGLVEWVAHECKRWKVNRLLIEDKARGGDVANELRRLYARERWAIELLPVEGDKVSRAHTCVPLFVDGAIWAPNTRWAEMVIKQCAQFPKASHDDLVDSVTQFVNWARVNELLIRGDEMTAVMEEDMKMKPRPSSVAEQYGVS